MDQQATRTKPRSHTKDYKRQVVDLVVSSGRKPVPVPTADQAAEIARLRRECDRLRMERDILKKFISIFAEPLR